MSRFFLGTLFAAFIAVTTNLGTPAHTGEATPEAPTDVRALGGVLTWSDNSDDEDGFRVVIAVGPSLGRPDLELSFQFSPDTTTFVLPPETRLGCPDRTAVSFRVTAFNEAGESDTADTAAISIQVLCPAPMVEPTTQPALRPTGGSTLLPVTGTLAQRNGHRPWLPGALAAGVALVLVTTGLAMRAKRS